ncbi:MAG: protein translocase subunit SecD [Bacteroidetes bacterium]|nr:protein translocase subunit SecD [Bacteroidota bacterium]
MKQNKLGKYLLIILPILAAAYLMWPTYRFYQLDKQRSEVSADSAALEQWDADNGEAYNKARAGRIKLGLDLRGGMYVTLEVDILKLIDESADPASKDDEFTKIVEKTRAETMNTDLDVLDTFIKNFKSSGKSLLQYFTVTGTQDVTEQAVIEKLKRDADGAVDQAMEVLRQRINKYSLSDVNIQKQGARRVLIELPDVKDEKEIRQLIQTTARLEFKRVLMNKDLLTAIQMVDNVMRGKMPTEDTVAAPAADTTKNAKDTAKTAQVAKADSAKADTTKTDSAKKNKDPYAGLSQEEASRRFRADHPFSSMIIFNAEGVKQPMPVGAIDLSVFPENAPFVLYVSGKDINRITSILERNDVRKAMPADLDIQISAKSEQNGQKGAVVPLDQQIFQVYGVAHEAELTGDVITEAWPTFDPTTNQPVVNMEMSTEGAEKWAQITGRNIKKRIAVVLDGRVYTAPTVENKIPNGSSRISGMANTEEATILAVVLKAGALKAPVTIIEERVVGPSLGEDSIRSGIMSTAISMAFIILFMLMYYSWGGGFADMALLMNVLLTVAALAGFGGTLTLPGIAGIILSTAMAVDANILIFERMREEMKAGRNLKSALEQGYSKAWSAIIDSNLTNMLAAIPLLVWGTGPIQGFAVTLLVGTILTLFTAVLLTRSMFELVVSSGAVSINIGQRKVA